jgi:hypothetical protein
MLQVKAKMILRMYLRTVCTCTVHVRRYQQETSLLNFELASSVLRVHVLIHIGTEATSLIKNLVISTFSASN